MSDYGSWKIDDDFTFTVNTHDPSTAAATDADSAPAYRIYEDETTVPILTGNMALLDGTNTDGFYSEQIALTAANGFEKDKAYHVFVEATVGGVSGTISHNFQIESSAADLVAIGGSTAAADNLLAMLNGTGATLTLDQLRVDAADALGGIYVTNSAGPGASIGGSTYGLRTVGTSAGGIGFYASGNTVGAGVQFVGGSLGAGFKIEGSNGNAIDIDSTGTDAINVTGGTNSDAVVLNGTGTGSGLNVIAGLTGNALTITGGGTSGEGIAITTVDGHGIDIDANGGGGNGFNIVSASANALNLGGEIRALSATSQTSHAIYAQSQGAVTGSGLYISSGTPDAAVQIINADTGNGVEIQGSDTGDALHLIGGATSGKGVYVTTTNGAGIHIDSTGAGIDIDATGMGIDIDANTQGVQISSTSSHALDLSTTAGVTGSGINILSAGAGTNNGISISASDNGVQILSLGGHGILSTVSGGTGNALALASAGSTGIDSGTMDEIADTILDTSISEPASVFTWAGSLRTIVGWLGALARNKATETAALATLRNDADTVDIATSVRGDDGVTFTRSEWT